VQSPVIDNYFRLLQESNVTSEMPTPITNSVESCFDYFRGADNTGATREVSNHPAIHVELGLVNLHNSELNFLS
jgi:hypothetical protein